MNAQRYLKTALTMLALLGSGAAAMAQDEQPNVAVKSSVTLVPGITDNGNGNARVISGGTVTRKSFIDANGNGTMSVFNNGVQQDYVVTPNGTFQVGSSVIQPDAGTIRDAQLMDLARQRAEDSLKETLGCTDAEWAILWPKIQLIQTLQNAAIPGQNAMVLKGGQNPPASVNSVRARLEEFQKLVNDKNAADAQVTQALASLRDARAKVKDELVRARKELTDLVTPRQEAILFQKGILAD